MAQTADLVVVGAGTVGGWASWFAATSGAHRVVVLEKDVAGHGASSRAAGVVRAQGGMPATVALGRFSIDFYRPAATPVGTDSGFRELGYLILARHASGRARRDARVAMQREAGLDVRWVDAPEACPLNPTLAPRAIAAAATARRTGAIDPPRNVRAYSLAMQQAGVELRERTPFLGCGRAAAGRARDRRRDARRRDRHRTRGPDGRTDAARGRQARRRTHLRGRRAPPGGRDRAASGVRGRTARRWCSTSAPGSTGGSRRAACSGGCRTRRSAGTPREVDCAVPAAHGAAPATARAGDRRARHPQGWCGDDRLHARTTCRSSDPVVTTDGDRIEGTTVASRRRPRDDVGPRRRARRRGPGARRAAPA